MGKALCFRTASQPCAPSHSQGRFCWRLPGLSFRLDPVFTSCVKGVGSPLGSQTHVYVPGIREVATFHQFHTDALLWNGGGGKKKTKLTFTSVV